MPLSNEVKRLQRSWMNQTAWPKRLNWIEIDGLRGWDGQRVDFNFPIVAIVGENGSGKSTILQASASIYQARASSGSKRQKDAKYPTDFFPDTFWDAIRDASVRFGYTEGENRNRTGSIRKPTERWKGYAERPIRPVSFHDLSRILPVGGRVGYAKIAKSHHTEATADHFDSPRLDRLSNILGHKYSIAKMAISSVDPNRPIPVLERNEGHYSGYHQGQGETTITELIQADLPKYSLVLIDEIESSLHPRAQRRLVRDLAQVCRERELQIVLSTHSPYILEELPPEARLQIFEQGGKRVVMTGVSPEFAMSKMDDIIHPEVEIYVEDEAAKILLTEIIVHSNQDLSSRIYISTFGSASVGYQLGHMVSNKKFLKAVGVFLDGDCKEGEGCCLLPGADAPEVLVFSDLIGIDWGDIWARLKRDTGMVSDACLSCMTLNDHHDWVADAAKKLSVSPTVLWNSMCAEWVEKFLKAEDQSRITSYIEDRLVEYS